MITEIKERRQENKCYRCENFLECKEIFEPNCGNYTKKKHMNCKYAGMCSYHGWNIALVCKNCNDYEPRKIIK